MIYLGIDYGTRRIGLAISDEEGKIAFPFGIVPNNKNALPVILGLIQRRACEGIVIGASYKGDGTPNSLMDEIQVFSDSLKDASGIAPIFIPEAFTSTLARGSEGKESRNARKAKAREGKHIDDQAAALILARYLDKLNFKNHD